MVSRSATLAREADVLGDVPPSLDIEAESASMKNDSSVPDPEQSPPPPHGSGPAPGPGPSSSERVQLDDFGNPILVKAKRGRKPGQKNSAVHNVMPPDDFSAAAMALNGTFFMTFSALFGDEVNPSQNEQMQMNHSLEIYLRQENTRLSPGVLLMMTYTGFMAMKLAQEKPRSKISNFMTYVRLRFFRKGAAT